MQRAIFALALMCAGSVTSAKDAKPIDRAEVERTRVELVADQDKFRGISTWAPKRARDLGGGALNTVAMKPVFFRREDGTEGFILRTRYSGYGWLFLNGSIIAVVDGKERIELTGEDSSAARKVEVCSGAAGCLVSEELQTPLSRDQAQTMANASTVEIRFYGRTSYIDTYFKPFHAAALKAVLAVGAPTETKVEPASKPLAQ